MTEENEDNRKMIESVSRGSDADIAKLSDGRSNGIKNE